MSSLSDKTILVVDDDKDTLNYIADIISIMDKITVYTASCGSEAIKILEERIGGVNLLLSDVVMPGMSGIELAKSLVEKFPTTKVILMSGLIQPSLTTENIVGHENGFIRKPFSGRTLTNHVKRALEELKERQPTS